MRSNILKALTKNWAFKLLAFFAAFTLWLIVYNLEDPTKTETMTIQVSVINKESVEKNWNKYYEIAEGSNKVTFSITAPRSILDKLQQRDFTAVADMEQLVINDDLVTGTAPIEISCTANYGDSVKLSTTTKSLHVKLEELMTKQFIVTPNAIGEVFPGYTLGHLTVTAPNVIRVSGPASLVDTISSAVAEIDVEGLKDPEVTAQPLVVLYDKTGKVVDTTRLNLSNERVTVYANILKVKEVPVTVKPMGTPADSYVVKDILYNPTTVTLKGSAEQLNAINAIEIPSALLNIEGATADVTASIDITGYLPNGVELMEKGDSTVDITIPIGKIKNKTFIMSTENIIVTGLPTGMDYSFSYQNAVIVIHGLEEDLNLLSNATLSGSVDVTGLEEGVHDLQLKLDIDEGKYTCTDMTVSIHIWEEVVDNPSENPLPDEPTTEEEQPEGDA